MEWSNETNKLTLNKTKTEILKIDLCFPFTTHPMGYCTRK